MVANGGTAETLRSVGSTVKTATGVALYELLVVAFLGVWGFLTVRTVRLHLAQGATVDAVGTAVLMGGPAVGYAAWHANERLRGLDVSAPELPSDVTG